MRDWLLQLLIYALIVWIVWGYVGAYIRARRNPLRVEEVWHGSSAEFADGGRYLAVEKHLGRLFRLSIRCDGSGELGLLLLISDRSTDHPLFEDGLLRFVTDEGVRHEGAARLIRADNFHLALDFEDRARLPILLGDLARSRSFFEVVASCALWDGERALGVGARGLGAQVSTLLAISERQKLYAAELAKLDDTTSSRH